MCWLSSGRARGGHGLSKGERKTKTAISAKALDKKETAKVNNPDQVYYSLKKNIDVMLNFVQGGRIESILHKKIIEIRKLHVAVPYSTTPAQWERLHRTVEYGELQGVKVIFTMVR